ncbi:POC1 centriolar protein A [Nowakowskiella sp. JEL0078]|nr:POC1 centriolar protein A [Nowakowskiella sp. JEL0078]
MSAATNVSLQIATYEADKSLSKRRVNISRLDYSFDNLLALLEKRLSKKILKLYYKDEDDCSCVIDDMEDLENFEKRLIFVETANDVAPAATSLDATFSPTDVSHTIWKCNHGELEFDYFLSHRQWCDAGVFDAATKPDNMFLEWEIALDMHNSNAIQLYPVLVGIQETVTRPDGKTQTLNVPFDGFGAKFPQELHCHAKSPKKRLISETMKGLFALQGCHVEQLKVNDLVTKLRNILSKKEIADIKSNVNKTQSSPLAVFSKQFQNVAPIATETRLNVSNEVRLAAPNQIRLYEDDLIKLRGWLKPLDKEMEKERSRLFEKHTPGTRKWLFNSIYDFLVENFDPKNSNQEQVLWLSGNAGVGKSVMAAYAATELEERNLLAGMFFAKHDDLGRNSAQNLIKTLAFQLCLWNPEFGYKLLDVLVKEKELFSEESKATTEKLFSTLILDPFRNLKSPTPIVLVIDALDETGKAGHRSDILQVFSTHCKNLPGFVKLLVTSRPEVDIVNAFSGLKQRTLSASDEQSNSDALVYIENFLKKKNSDSKENASLLVKKSGGLFVWLVLACNYLENYSSITVELIEELSDGSIVDESGLDKLYYSIFDRIFTKEPPSFLHRILSAIVLVYEPLTAVDFSILLEIELKQVEQAIEVLQSLLNIDDASGKIRVFHKSVADYLTTPERCSDSRFAIHVADQNTALTANCLRIMNSKLTFNMAELPWFTFHKDIYNFEEKVKARISSQLRYASLHFWNHFSESTPSSETISLIQTLLSEHLLHLLELLSLLSSTGIILKAIVTLTRTYEHHVPKQSKNDYSLSLLSDTDRVVRKFSVSLIASALQVYWTAVPFSPKESTFYRLFHQRLPVEIHAAGTGTNWPACLSTFEGHTSQVKGVAFSPDGTLVASASFDETIKIWSVETGEMLKSLKGHTSYITSVAFSADGLNLVSTSRDETVRIWSVTGEELKTFKGHTGWVNSAAFSPDGQLIASASDDESIRLWSVVSGHQVKSLIGHSRQIKSVAFSGNGKWLVSGSFDRSVKIWAVTGEEAVKSFDAGGVNCVAFSLDSKIVASGDERGVKVWSVESGEMLYSWNSSFVLSVAISNDGKTLVSGTTEKIVTVFTLESGQEVQTLEGHSDYVESVAFSTDNRFVVSGSQDKSIKIWAIGSGDAVEPKGHTQEVSSVEFSYDRSIVASTGWDRTVRIWSVERGDVIQTIKDNWRFNEKLEFSPDGRFVFTYEYGGIGNVWSLDSGLKVEAKNPIESLLIIRENQKTNISLNIVQGVFDGWILLNKHAICWIDPKLRGNSSAKFALSSDR